MRMEDAKEAKVQGSEPAEGKQRQKGHGKPGKGKCKGKLCREPTEGSGVSQKRGKRREPCREPTEGKQRQREPGEGWGVEGNL